MKTFIKQLLGISLILSTHLIAKDIYTVGFAQDTLANDWRLAQVNEVRDEVKKYPYLKLIVKDAKTSVANQIADIEYFIENDYDFIITSPINAGITSMASKKALAKDIKVILIDRGIDSDDYTVFASPDNRLIAKKIAKYMAKELKGSGTILMLEGVKGASPTIQRGEGFEEIMKQYPDIKIIKRRANYLRADAITVMEEIYKNGIKFDAIFSQSDSMLIGARYVMKKYNQDLSILIVGIDYIKESQEAILKGVQTASFTYPTAGKQGVEAIIDIIAGKKIVKDQTIESIMVTKHNAKIVPPIF